ncbi:hypothetical protein EJB05_07559, partial [Eragrostis curvula]
MGCFGLPFQLVVVPNRLALVGEKNVKLLMVGVKTVGPNPSALSVRDRMGLRSSRHTKMEKEGGRQLRRRRRRRRATLDEEEAYHVRLRRRISPEEKEGHPMQLRRRVKLEEEEEEEEEEEGHQIRLHQRATVEEKGHPIQLRRRVKLEEEEGHQIRLHQRTTVEEEAGHRLSTPERCGRPTPLEETGHATEAVTPALHWMKKRRRSVVRSAARRPPANLEEEGCTTEPVTCELHWTRKRRRSLSRSSAARKLGQRIGLTEKDRPAVCPP